jgi:hypothetical protein
MRNMTTIANLWEKLYNRKEEVVNKGFNFTKSNKICPNIVIGVLNVSE